MLIGKLGARACGLAPKRNIPWQRKALLNKAIHSISTPERRHRDTGAIVRASESDAKQLEQDLQADMEDNKYGNRNGLSEPESVGIDSKSSVARACSQAVDGLDKLLSSDELQPQPLRHRSKALQVLDSAGKACRKEAACRVTFYSSRLC